MVQMFGNNQIMAKILILAGIILLILGIMVYYFGNIFSWFGSLPGDIKIKNENFSFYFPVTSMILLSLLLNLIFKLFSKFNS